MDGFATAFGEITLVLFTTLAPAGAVAYAFMALPFVARGNRIETAMRRRLETFLCIPAAAATVGLVASATHLGNPANALYVLAGFGRSPLSNEVVMGVVFLGSAGVLWLTSFSETEKRLALRRVLTAVVSVLGLVFVGAISLAYDADTIITWSTPYAILSVWLNAFLGGPLLAILSLRIAGFYVPKHRLGSAYIVVSTIALVANVIVYIAWGMSLPLVENSMTSANMLAPLFGPMTAAFAVLSVIGLLFSAKAVWYKEQTPLWAPVCSVLFVLAGIFVMRFAFYMIHMTAGLGV